MLEKLIERKICAETTVLNLLGSDAKSSCELLEVVNPELLRQHFGEMPAPYFETFLQEMCDRGLISWENGSKLAEDLPVVVLWHSTGKGTRLLQPVISSFPVLDLHELLAPKVA